MGDLLEWQITLKKFKNHCDLLIESYNVSKSIIKEQYLHSFMALTKEETVVLKALLLKELAHVKNDAKRLVIVNSPFLNKVVDDQADLPFLKSELLYQQFLEQLLKKL